MTSTRLDRITRTTVHLHMGPMSVPTSPSSFTLKLTCDQAWEFKHPEFQANKKDSLDNIRRKAPAPRKPTQALEEGFPSQQMDLVNSQLMATQQQLQQLSERYQDLAQGHVVLLQQVVQLQKFVKNHDGVMNRVVGYLHNVDTQRRNNRIGGSFSGTAPGMNVGDPMAADPSDDHPASPLQQASQLLSELSAENLPNKELEQMTQDYHLRPEYSTPPNDQNGSGMAQAETPSAHIGYQAGNDLDNMVYPVGHTNGIDPINSEHIHNIPYALPANGMLQVDTMPEIIPESSSSSGEKKGNTDSGWGLTKPRILLVEDDKVCARIGSKFLQAFECGVETAVSHSNHPVQLELTICSVMDSRPSARLTTRPIISTLFLWILLCLILMESPLPSAYEEYVRIFQLSL